MVFKNESPIGFGPGMVVCFRPRPRPRPRPTQFVPDIKLLFYPSTVYICVCVCVCVAKELLGLVGVK